MVVDRLFNVYKKNITVVMMDDRYIDETMSNQFLNNFLNIIKKFKFN